LITISTAYSSDRTRQRKYKEAQSIEFHLLILVGSQSFVRKKFAGSSSNTQKFALGGGVGFDVAVSSSTETKRTAQAAQPQQHSSIFLRRHKHLRL
jgi:hypothetical protein